jgi:hypothetical protein
MDAQEGKDPNVQIFVQFNPEFLETQGVNFFVP